MQGYLAAIAGTVIFSLFAGINYRIGRSWLYPAAAMNGAWAVVFLALCFATSWLYAVPYEALAIYVLGAVFYSLGAYFAFAGIGSSDGSVGSSIEYKSDLWLLVLLLTVLLGGFPFYLREVESLTTAALFTPEFFLQLRAAELAQSWTQNRAPLVNNLVVLSDIAVLVAMFVSDGARRWKWLLIAIVCISFVYNLLTGAKVGFASVVVELLVIYYLRRKTISILAVLITVAIFLAGFGLLTVARVEATHGIQLGYGGVAKLTGQTLLNYLTVSVVGFGLYIKYPGIIPPIRSIWLFFERTANYFGNFFLIPKQQGMFIGVGPNLSYNTYTAYFTYYPEYGVLGVAAIMFFVGLVATLAYRAARRGAFLSTLIYAYLFFGTVMTIYNESIFISLNFFVKLLFVGLIFIIGRRLSAARIRHPEEGTQIAKCWRP